MSELVKIAPHSRFPAGWFVRHTQGMFADLRPLTYDEAVRHEWGEACWTARLLAGGEVARRVLAEEGDYRRWYMGYLGLVG